MQQPNTGANGVLTTHNLGKCYPNQQWGLRDASLTLQAGRMIAIVGPNGAGKSTLIHMLAGAIQPTTGEIIVQPPHLRIGWSSQRTTIDWYLNVRQNVELGGRMYGLSRHVSRARATELLDRFGLANLATRDVSMLSGGQQQRIQVARTLMSDPDVMLLDEPTASLDVESSESVLRYLQERTAGGALALISSHDLGLLERYCDEVIFVLDGRVVDHRTMRDFLRDYAPTARVKLVLSEPVTDAMAAALAEYSPFVPEAASHEIDLTMPDERTISDVVRLLDGFAQVTDVRRESASLRDIYLQLSSEGSKQ